MEKEVSPSQGPTGAAENRTTVEKNWMERALSLCGLCSRSQKAWEVPLCIGLFSPGLRAEFCQAQLLPGGSSSEMPAC